MLNISDIIQSVESRLICQVDKAAEKLVMVLKETLKVHLAIEIEMFRYLSLNFDFQKCVFEQRFILLLLEGRELQTCIIKHGDIDP